MSQKDQLELVEKTVKEWFQVSNKQTYFHTTLLDLLQWGTSSSFLPGSCNLVLKLTSTYVDLLDILECIKNTAASIWQ